MKIIGPILFTTTGTAKSQRKTMQRKAVKLEAPNVHIVYEEICCRQLKATKITRNGQLERREPLR